jgi:peptide/nickel transport system permease protein
MPFRPVFLATDVLVWLLVAAVAFYAVYCSRRPHLAAPWARVFRSRAAMASAVVLGAFVAIGLADSLHFRPRLEQQGTQQAAYSVEVLSVLDVALSHLRGRRERTYSAPLATRAYSREMIELPDGRQVREFPRLRHGGAHLAHEGEWPGDVAKKTLAGLGIAAVLFLFAFTAAKPLKTRRPDIPWNAALAALGAILVLAGPAFALSAGYHVFGTDKVGQDVLYLALKSVRTSLAIGTLTTLVLLPLGVALGIMAGYFKGWVDDVIQYVYTTLNSIPAVLLIAAAVLMMQVYIDTHPELFPTAAQRADLRLLFLCVILGLTSWTGLARLLRGETLKLSELEYIQAAHAFGVAHARVLSRHILPNVAHIVVIALVMDFSGLVLAEAVLSYVGVGVDPSTTSFGTMINSARLEMSREPIVWWALAAAFSFMFVLVLAANLFADAVRDGFDPRVRVGRTA